MADLVSAINKREQSNVPTLKLAEIVDVSSTFNTWSADIKFDDDSPMLESVYGLSSYTPKIGDIVRVAMVPGGGPLILGTVWRTHGQPSNVAQTAAVFGGTSNYTSLTYVNLLGVSNSFYKHQADGHTAANVRIRGTCYCAQATTIMMLGVQVDGTDIDMSPFFFNTALQHTSVTAEKKITGLNQGAHTFQSRIKITGGTAVTKQITFDTSDAFTITIEEVLDN